MDRIILQFIQQAIPRSWDVGLSLLSVVGSFEVTTTILFLLVFLYLQTLRARLKALVLYGVGMAIEIFGKEYLFHPGPPKRFFRTHLPFSLPSNYVHTTSSFPSGHSFRTVFLATIIWQLLWASHLSLPWKRTLSILLVGFVMIMLLSRVSLGEHWPSDVLGGLGLGLILGWCARYLLPTSK